MADAALFIVYEIQKIRSFQGVFVAAEFTVLTLNIIRKFFMELIDISNDHELFGGRTLNPVDEFFIIIEALIIAQRIHRPSLLDRNIEHHHIDFLLESARLVETLHEGFPIAAAFFVDEIELFHRPTGINPEIKFNIGLSSFCGLAAENIKILVWIAVDEVAIDRLR
jgi:hypothetical protein